MIEGQKSNIHLELRHNTEDQDQEFYDDEIINFCIRDEKYQLEHWEEKMEPIRALGKRKRKFFESKEEKLSKKKIRKQLKTKVKRIYEYWKAVQENNEVVDASYKSCTH